MDKRTVALLLLLSKYADAMPQLCIEKGARFDIREGKLVVDQQALQKLKEILVEDEGLELKPYHDLNGHLTIGIGRNLESVGISEREAFFLLDNDIHRVLLEAQNSFPWFNTLTPARQVVVLSMIFNLGIVGFKGFHKMIKAIEREDFVTAAREMMRSEWESQVGKRALEMSKLMKVGTF